MINNTDLHSGNHTTRRDFIGCRILWSVATPGIKVRFVTAVRKPMNRLTYDSPR